MITLICHHQYTHLQMVSKSRCQHLHVASHPKRLRLIKHFILTSVHIRCNTPAHSAVTCLRQKHVQLHPYIFSRSNSRFQHQPVASHPQRFRWKAKPFLMSARVCCETSVYRPLVTLVIYFCHKYVSMHPVHLLKICARCVATDHFLTIQIFTPFTPVLSILRRLKYHPSVEHT